MESFFRGIIRFRWLVIMLVLGCTGLAWVQLGKLRFESDADAMLPPSDPVIGYNDLVEDRFGIRDLIIIGVLNDNPGENGVFNPRTLGIVKEFSEQIARLPGIKAVRDEDVASIATLDNITGTVDGMAVRPFMDDVPRRGTKSLAAGSLSQPDVRQLGGVAGQDGLAHYGPDGARRGDSGGAGQTGGGVPDDP